jgi:hypothetical protein
MGADQKKKSLDNKKLWTCCEAGDARALKPKGICTI